MPRKQDKDTSVWQPDAAFAGTGLSGAVSADAAAPGPAPAVPASPDATLPDWLSRSEDYRPGHDRDAFIAKSLLSVTGVLARLRLDDGVRTRLSPSAGCKIACGLACILLTSLARNYAFVLVMLALVLGRMAALPAKVLRRTASVAFAAAGLTALLMLPAALLGQAQSSLLVGTKVLVTVSLAMIVAGTTPFHELTAALRDLHVPDVVIMTVDLALRSIALLGRLAVRTLTALKLRSVGVNGDKASSVGGVGGVLFLKSGEAAATAHDAMVCRGFTGEYHRMRGGQGRRVDAAWVAGTVALAVLFCYLQSLT